MWIVLVLLGLPSLGSRVPSNARHLRALPRNDSHLAFQSSSTPPTPTATPTVLPTHSEAPALSLNLGLNFKIKVRSQGTGQQGEGPRGATTHPGAPSTSSQAPGSRLWAEALSGSGWLGPGPADELPSGPKRWAWEGSPGPAEPSLLASSPSPLLPLSLWPRLAKEGLAVPVAGEDSRELELKIDIDLTAGLGKEGGLEPNSSSPGWHHPLLPGLRVGIAEMASKLQGFPGLFGSRLPPGTWEPPAWNATGSSIWELPGESPPTPEGALEPGLESSSPAASPGSGGAFVGLPGCLPDHLEDCGSPLPEPGAPPLSALLLFVPLRSDWHGAQAAWGLAWEAQAYGSGSLFALLALLALLGLVCLPCRCPAGCKTLALLHLLLVGAGGARATLLLGDASGQLAAFPGLAVQLLHELALPCLTSALALGCLLLSRRPPAERSGLRHPCWLALLLLLHFSAATGAVLAAEWRPPSPALLLASRGVFAALAALLSCSFLAFYCLAQTSGLKATALPACQCPFADARQWGRAASTALPAASFGLLSAGLHTYTILHALGYGLSPELFGPWPRWALQLACRLCEAGMGLPLALLGLYPLLCAPSSEAWCQCCGLLRCCSPECAAAKAAPVLPNSFLWASSQHEKLVMCDTVLTRSASDYLPLYALPAEEPSGSIGGCSARAPSLLSITVDTNDPTVDFCPPSPIDLRRSIDEALGCEGFFPGGRPLSASSPLSLQWAREQSGEGSQLCLCPTASCVEVAQIKSPGQGEASLQTTRANTPLPFPEPWQGSSSPSKQHLTDNASLALSPSPEAPGSPPYSPPPPGRQRWVLAHLSQESLASVGQQGAETALLQAEFMDVCRQIDALSVSSDTIDL